MAEMTFYVGSDTRELVGRLSSEHGQCLAQVAIDAIVYYRGLLDTGEAAKPVRGRLGSSKGSRRIGVAGQPEIADWVAAVADELKTTRGQVLTTALGYYAEAVESGRVARPEPESQPETSKPRKRAATLVKPTSAPTLTDRQCCSGCGKQLRLTEVNGEPVLDDHMVFIRDESDPRGGTHGKCPGSGKPGDGIIVHAADTTRRLS